jgi:hypothetical protein
LVLGLLLEQLHSLELSARRVLHLIQRPEHIHGLRQLAFLLFLLLQLVEVVVGIVMQAMVLVAEVVLVTKTLFL